MSEDLDFGAARSAIEVQQKRLEKELYAAWRAGYNYLHTTVVIRDDFEAVFFFFPARSKLNPFETPPMRTYDLREESLSDEQWRELYEIEYSEL